MVSIMLERVRREICAISPVTSVNTGRIRWRAQDEKPFDRSLYPVAGNQLR
jgi:hypothetical protein